MTYRVPEPPEGRFGKWAYQLWEYVAKNRAGAAVSLVGTGGITVGTGTGTFTLGLTQILTSDVLGTSATGTLPAVLSTTGVIAGTYGAATLAAQLVVDAKGRITSATSVAIGGTAWQQNRFVLNSGETLAISSNLEVIFGPTFTHTSGGTLSIANGGRMGVF